MISHSELSDKLRASLQQRLSARYKIRHLSEDSGLPYHQLITGGSDLHKDLVGHIYLLLHDRNIPEEDLPRTFARFAFNQWKWPGSDWNKQFNTMAHMVSLDYDIPLQSDDENEEGEYQEYLREYMERESTDDQELFIKEVTRMHLYGMTYRDIRSQTGLSLRVIHSAIKQFKYDLSNNHPDVHWVCQGSPDF